ncbi:sterile alpha motif domain-containing protein 9-like [Scomber scombrus]|uniref:sterile alpha motif domain-containing protein 9-like n=1 Tax=Scomber scombrus TaxID=13677 RepID=UPI002DD849F4|nr:sterile alpha motif domain-containing protein 9-like [Scomber scombrus]
MASGLALSTAKSGNIFVGSEIRDSLSLLDVLYANQFEGESLDPEVVEQTEETFYRGAPPKWLNFHISEQAESDSTGTSFIKRDGYDRLRQQIQNKRRLHGISTVKLFHQPGCGGTTLAMQVLWDLRKTFRCAVLTGSTSDITNVATEVVHLFTAGSRRNQNTVLLLLNDEHNLENLQDSIMEKMAEQKTFTTMPVVIFLTCVRKNAVLQNDHVVLQKVLSDTEKQKFNEKKEELIKKYRDRCGQFHGFNIMQTNFSQAYVEQACTVFSTVQRSKKSLKTQLATFLSLLNAYVPGSYLLESQCLDFLQHEDSINGHLSLEDRMRPFSHLIITFQHDARSGKKVCMAHPMIAQCCTELMGDAGVTRSDTARNFLNCLCRDEVSPWLLGFVKDMLTKREMKVEENPVKGKEVKEERERFSRLILDIQSKECEVHTASVLKMASMIFLQNPFFPQALARFYYIELKDFNKAESWAKEAKERDPKKSFVADTLGQVYKNQLKNKEFSTKPREILKLATKAIRAFKDEEQLAENEYGADMAEDGNTKVFHIFNTRGQFGYLQVCNLIYDRLVAQNEIWKRVLTNNVSMGSVLGSLGDNKLYRFNHLISSLRDEVEKKCNFLNAYLTFSKPGMQKDDPSYIQRDVSSCYLKYAEHPLPDLISDIMDKCEDNVEENMSPSDEDSPESHIIALLKEWAEDNKNNSSDLMLVTQKINHSYECTYAKYLRSRGHDDQCQHTRQPLDST